MILLLLAALQQPDTTTLLARTAARARQVAATQTGVRPVALAQTQYRSALASLQAGQWADAVTTLTLATRLNANSALYKAEMGYALAQLQRWDEAATNYQAASQLQSENPWLYVGLGLARAGQQRWMEAGGMFALAANSDSSVISQQFVENILDYYERAGRQSAQIEWYSIGTRRFPDVPLWWLRLAQAQRARRDTAAMSSIRRYLAQRPDEPIGMATYATLLYEGGQADSALTYAQRLSADTAYRGVAASLFLGIGAQAYQARDYVKASTVLRMGQPFADAETAPRIALYLGYSDLQRAVQLAQASDQARDCDAARAADSMATLAERNLRAGRTLDTANADRALTTSIPQLRAAADGLKTNFCRAAPARRRP